MTDGLRGLQDLTRMLLDAELSELRQLSEEDFGDRAPVIAADGTLAPR